MDAARRAAPGEESGALEQYQEFAINYCQDEDGVFAAVVLAIRGCVASGRTLEEAYRHAVEAIESCMEARERVAALKRRRVDRVALCQRNCG